MDRENARGPEIHVAAALEGCADYFFGRPVDENPYARDYVDGWRSWLEGWRWGELLDCLRGDRERARWAS